MNRTLLPALALGLALGLGVARADDAAEARALFDAMHAKLTQAKTIKLAFRANVGPQGQELKLGGDLFLAEGDNVSLLTTGQDPTGQTMRAAVVSNGTEVFRWRQDTKAQAAKAPTPKNLGPQFRACLSKLTALGSAFLFNLPQDGTADPFVLDNFVLGAEQKVEARTLRQIQYDVSIAAGQLSRVVVWIDTATKLPAQRRIQGGQQGVAIVEVFTKIELDVELPEGVFKIPEVQEPATPAAPAQPPATPAPPVDPENAKRARALLEAAEAKLNAAKTLRVTSTTLMGPPAQRAQLATRLELGSGGRVHLAMKGRAANGTAIRLEIVSDGKRRLTVQAAGEREQRDLDDAAPQLGSVARKGFSRLTSTVLLRRDPLDDPTIPVANFVLGPVVKEDGRELQMIEFDSTAPDLPMHVSLWIDTTTGLPAKRVIGDSSHAEAMMEFVETIEIDVELDEATFTVPEK